MQNRKQQIWWYVICDYLAAALAWYVLFLFRKVVIEANAFNLALPFGDSNFWVAMFIVPQLWLLFYYVSGTYTDLYKKSRLQEVIKTIVIGIAGSFIIFFLLLLDDYVRKYSDYYLTFCVLSVSHITIALLVRVLLLNRIKKQLSRGEVTIPALIIGNNTRANEMYEEIKAKQASFGLKFIGYLQLNGTEKNTLSDELTSLGTLHDLERILTKHPEIEEIIIGIETSEHHLLNSIINRLGDKNLTIRIIPDMYDILSGTVKMNHVIGEGFIEIPPFMLAEWERITKRFFDVLGSTFALIISSPLLLFVAIKIKMTDKGSIFYTQERSGQYGKPFHIYKFRSMYTNAEQHGPQLTTENDPRITPVGRWIRKYRVDEFPQFINVLKGEMSIVGPRAERKFFVDQIIAHAPYYSLVFRVQPGITSLGMVKYGYASTVEEMVKRLKYDIIYIENMSILMDFKIMIYTVQTVLYGRGK
jgi:exopolysaccharide biosynthesis polyprenyl glycosylphosphotransferase